MKHRFSKLIFVAPLAFFLVFVSFDAYTNAADTQSGYRLLANIPTITNPDGTPKTTGITLVDYMKGVFVATIGLAIVLAVVQIVIGGIEYVAAAVPSAKEEGKKKIGGAVGGLLLILLAWVLLQALNVKLLNVGFNLEKIATVGGSGGGQPPPSSWCLVDIVKKKILSQNHSSEQTCKMKRSAELFQNSLVCKLCSDVTGGGGGGGGPSGNEAINQKKLTDASISIKPGVSVAGTRDGVLNEVIALKKSCPSCNIVVTSGTEGSHAEGPFSHANGFKIDLRDTSDLTQFITTSFPSIGTRGGDGAKLFRSPSGAIFAQENNHFDLLVRED